MASILFDPIVEQARFEARGDFLKRQARLRVDFGAGVFIQPETKESVADQVRESLWAEGKTPESCDADELAEVQASFAVLSPRRESDGGSFAATLMIGTSDSERVKRLESLTGFPEGLGLFLSDGSVAKPEVDRGLAPEGERMPSVLALRWKISANLAPVAFVSFHAALPGRWAAPSVEAWMGGQ